MLIHRVCISLLFCLSFLGPSFAVAASDNLDDTVEQAVAHLLEQAPGVAVAISKNGQDSYYSYGQLSKSNPSKVSQNTLFAIGSVSKTFTASVAAILQQRRLIQFNDPVSDYLTELKGTVFDEVTLLNLLTHTSGLPLKPPAEVQTKEQLTGYLRDWQPDNPIGTERVYSNIGVGLMSYVVESATSQSYQEVLRDVVLTPLGLTETFLILPKEELSRYAMAELVDSSKAPLFPAAGDMKSTSHDLLTYLKAQLGLTELDATLAKGLINTHVAYFATEDYRQDLMWESYPYPVALETLQQPLKQYLRSPVSAVVPPKMPSIATWFHKTGTNDQNTAYALFIPQEQLAVVVLVSGRTPTKDNIKAGYQIAAAVLAQTKSTTK